MGDCLKFEYFYFLVIFCSVPLLYKDVWGKIGDNQPLVSQLQAESC